MSPTGLDTNSGASTNAPWLTPNHPLNCNDTIVAAIGTYGQLYLPPVVTCVAGNSLAWLQCATFDGCKINVANGNSYYVGIQIGGSYWGVQGWEVHTTSTAGACFAAYPATAALSIHHIAFVNDVANGCGQGAFEASSHSSAGVDYLAVVGNIAYNSVQGSALCTSGINVYQPAATDSIPGTHIFIGGNFAFGNVEPSICSAGNATDGQGVFIDTTGSYAQQIVITNNLLVYNGGSGIKVYNSAAPVWIQHNTTYGNETGGVTGGVCAEIALQNASAVNAQSNLSETWGATACLGGQRLYLMGVISPSALDMLSGNAGYSAAGQNTNGYGSGFVFGPANIFGAAPGFANPVMPPAPACSGKASVPNCMAGVIASFAASGLPSYGYQVPNNVGVYDPLFPQWLCNVHLPPGLVTMGCGGGSSFRSVAAYNMQLE